MSASRAASAAETSSSDTRPAVAARAPRGAAATPAGHARRSAAGRGEGATRGGALSAGAAGGELGSQYDCHGAAVGGAGEVTYADAEVASLLGVNATSNPASASAAQLAWTPSPPVVNTDAACPPLPGRRLGCACRPAPGDAHSRPPAAGDGVREPPGPAARGGMGVTSRDTRALLLALLPRLPSPAASCPGGARPVGGRPPRGVAVRDVAAEEADDEARGVASRERGGSVAVAPELCPRGAAPITSDGLRRRRSRSSSSTPLPLPPRPPRDGASTITTSPGDDGGRGARGCGCVLRGG